MKCKPALWSPVLLAALATAADTQFNYKRELNSSSSSSTSRSSSQTSSSTPARTVLLTSSSSTSTTSSTGTTSLSTSTRSPTGTTSLSTSSGSTSSSSASTRSTLSTSGSQSSRISSLSATTAASNATISINKSISSSSAIANSTSSSPPQRNTTKPAITACTGCALEARSPTTLSFKPQWTSTWEAIVVTQTNLTVVATYWYNSTIQYSTTEYTLLDITTNIPGLGNKTITHTAPSFTWEPGPGQTVTLAAGPTYVAYTNLWGGIDTPLTLAMTPSPTRSYPLECEADLRRLPSPTNVADYRFFIETYPNGVPEVKTDVVPPGVVNNLKNRPGISAIFKGSDIATCTVHSSKIWGTYEISTASSSAPQRTLTEESTRYAYPTGPPPVGSFQPTTTTYISKSIIGTEKHVSRQGSLRTSQPAPQPDPMKPTAEPSKVNEPPTAVNAPQPTGNLDSPQHSQPQGEQRQSVVIGTELLPIWRVNPTPTGQENDPNRKDPPVYVVGSNTLAPGETATINNIQVVYPTGSDPVIVVAQSTVPINNPGPTGPPIMTVGEKTVTANTQGLFVIDTQTLSPGGPPITVDGTTLSLGPSGTIAVIDGVTQTIGNSPIVTNAPVLTVGSQTIPATILSGSTQFVLAPGKTLTPGGVLTVDGTTFSMPTGVSGSTVVVNGVTSTLKGTTAPVITVNSQSVTAAIISGTTAFIVGPGQTLTPGGTITVSGTTLSMPASASGSIIVVNGVTSTLKATGAPVLTLNNKAVTASVVGGTTAFVLGPGQTLTPGAVLTVSGTTFSMPASGSGSVIVVDGVTSTLGRPAITSAPALTIEGKTISPTVRDGTTEYVLGTGTTLKPGSAVTISGTTYSLDPKGTALVINGKTSSIPKLPASNSASTTGSSSRNSTSSGSSTTSSSSTSDNNQRNPGNFIASGIGLNPTGGAVARVGGGLDKMVEGLVIGVAGWLLMFL